MVRSYQLLIIILY